MNSRKLSVFVANSQTRWPDFKRLLPQPTMLPLKTGLYLLGVSLLYALNGAHNTEDLGFIHRLSLWSVVFSLTTFQFLIASMLLTRMKLLSSANKWIGIGASILVTCALLTLELHALKYTAFLPKNPDPLIEFYLFLLPTVAVWCCLLVLIEPRAATDSEEVGIDSEAVPETTDSKLKDLLAREQVLHIAACDHYLEISCMNNRHLIRGKMKDAVALLQNEDGVQVHRSHWVATKAIATTLRKGRDLKLVLTTGEKISVSRSKVPLLNSLISSVKQMG